MIFFHLKNRLFPCISRQRLVHFPRRIFFLRAFRFRPKTSIFPCLFEQKSAFFTVFTAYFCAFIQSSSPVRTEFPLHSVQNKTAENPPVIFYLCTALKPRIFPCADAAKRLPFQGSWPSPRGLRGFTHVPSAPLIPAQNPRAAAAPDLHPGLPPDAWTG